MSHKRKSYTSDLSESQWMIIKDLLPLERKGPGRPLEIDMREVVNAVLSQKKLEMRNDRKYPQ